MKPINKDILKLAIPSILANITVPLVGMVDIAVAGHLDAGAATMIGGIAIGTMLFDLLYWNFGFLRVGTGGLAAQAFGRGDMKECARIFARAIGISLVCALALIAVQWIFVKAAFLVVDCTPEVRSLASHYFYIRIWAAPATLSLMALKGWFIGMQDTVSPMLTDLVVNGMNVLASIVLALGIGSYEGMGFAGIAVGTVVAQYCGLFSAVLLLVLKYSRKVMATLRRSELKGIFMGSETRRFFVMNRDLFIRSLCFIAIYIGFTVISARYGDVLLAVSSIMMKILMIFSYFTDGFAYAGEALSGKYIGAKDKPMLRQTVRWTFIWSMAIAVLFMGIYHFGGVPLLRMMTSDTQVVEAAKEYLPWLLLMPLIGCAAFTWDGIYIGATAAKAIRNSMIWAVVAFVLTWILGLAFINIMTPVSGPASETLLPSSRYGRMAMHALMAAYFAHLLARTVYLSAKYRKVVLTEPWREKYSFPNGKRYNSFVGYFKRKYGERLQKIVLDAGFTCPNRDGTVGRGGCTYCDNAAFHPSYSTAGKSLHRQMDEGIEFHKVRYRTTEHYLAYFQSFSNTYAPLERLKALYGEALEHPSVVGIVIGTRPDCVDEQKLDYLASLKNRSDHPVVIVEYGIESCYDSTLQRINRGHDFETARRAVRMTAERGIDVGAHFILGLPGETRQMMLDSCAMINELPLRSVKFHQLQIVKGTRMEQEYAEHPEDFERFTLDGYIDFFADMLERLKPELFIERFVGEVPPRFVNETPWGLIRNVELLRLLEKRLEERDTWQGRLVK